MAKKALKPLHANTTMEFPRKVPLSESHVLVKYFMNNLRPYRPYIHYTNPKEKQNMKHPPELGGLFRTEKPSELMSDDFSVFTVTGSYHNRRFFYEKMNVSTHGKDSGLVEKLRAKLGKYFEV